MPSLLTEIMERGSFRGMALRAAMALRDIGIPRKHATRNHLECEAGLSWTRCFGELGADEAADLQVLPSNPRCRLSLSEGCIGLTCKGDAGIKGLGPRPPCRGAWMKAGVRKAVPTSKLKRLHNACVTLRH